MAIFYSDDRAPFTGRPVPYDDQPATRYYLSHYSNYLVLDAITRAPRDASERRDAVRELSTCERKLAHWRRHPNFDLALATRETAKLKAAWAPRPT